MKLRLIAVVSFTYSVCSFGGWVNGHGITQLLSCMIGAALGTVAVLLGVKDA